MRLEVENLSAGYGSAQVVRDVSFAIDSGAAFGILGRNGMGKTTLIRSILGLLPRQDGSVRIGDNDVSGWPTYRVIRLGIGYGPQEAAIFPDRTVEENLVLGSLRVRNLSSQMKLVLEDFPILSQRLRQTAGTLSGGEQKMLILARALLGQPRLLILDEVTEGLQPLVIAAAVKALIRAREEYGTTLLLVEQRMEVALSVCDTVGVLQVGEFLFQRPVHEHGLRDQIEAAFSL